MKKYVLLFIMMIGLCIPHFVAADVLPPNAKAYTEEKTIKNGTIVTYIVSGHVQIIDGKISYNSSMLELVKYELEEYYCYYDVCEPPTEEDLVQTADLKVNTNVPGSFEYETIGKAEYVNGLGVKLTFKVKSNPGNSEIKIKYIPKNPYVLENSEYATNGYLETGILTSCKDGVCPEEDEEFDDEYEDEFEDGYEDFDNQDQEENNDLEDNNSNDQNFDNDDNSSEDSSIEEETKDTTKVEKNDDDKENNNVNVLLYIIIAIAFVIIVVLLVLLKKKQNQEKTDNSEINNVLNNDLPINDDQNVDATKDINNK